MDKMTKAAVDVLAERKRQVEAEGWTPEHDDRHKDCELAAAAACYATCDDNRQLRKLNYDGVPLWPWAAGWWKPAGYRRNLVKAAALLLAEIERLDRRAASEPHVASCGCRACDVRRNQGILPMRGL